MVTGVAGSRKLRRVRSRLALLCALTVAVASPFVVAPTGRDVAAARHTGRPNVLIILTDDQRASGTLGVMPETKRRFYGGGTRFTQAFATTPLCCPSRASIMTGRYAHNHRVRTNEDAAYLDQTSTLQSYLQRDGYRTAIFGKFLNGWDFTRDPPHFDDWTIGQKPTRYEDGMWNIEGTITDVTKYSTNFVADEAVRFLHEAEADDSQPWLMYVTPGAPHMPAVPEAEYANAPLEPWKKNPAVLEKDRTDKPPYVQARSSNLRRVRRIRAMQLRALFSVDDLVTRIFRSADRLDENRSTLAFFLSDNGFLWGEHGLSGSAHQKRSPYTQSIKLPFLMRWPGHVASSVIDDRLVANIDIAPTVLDAAQLSPRLVYPMDGRSLLDSGARRWLLLEHWREDKLVPQWAALRSAGVEYVEYYGDDGLTPPTFQEFYRLATDRWQLDNLLGDARAGNDPVNVSGLAARLDRARRCIGDVCP